MDVIDKVLEILRQVADQYQAERYAYVVMEGMHKDYLKEHGSMEEYCEKCIEHAVDKEKKEYIEERAKFMGKIYEVSKKGYAIEAHYKWDKNGAATSGIKLAKVFNTKKESVTKEEVVKHLEKRLRKQYSAKRIFSSQCYNISCSESEGFKNCDSCGVTFEYGLILTDQELSHWEELTCERLIITLQEPQSAYELSRILEHWAYEEYRERIVALAEKLLLLV
jgi:hypothetical protein